MTSHHPGEGSAESLRPWIFSGRLPLRGPRINSTRLKTRLEWPGGTGQLSPRHSTALPHARTAGPEPQASPFRPRLSLRFSTCWVTDPPYPTAPRCRSWERRHVCR